MMDCAQHRRSLMADPHDPDPRLREHRESCRECTRFAADLLRFESRLERALRVTPPAGTDRAPPLRAAAARRMRSSAAYRRGWLAMAAGVLLAVAVAGVLWVAAPGASIAADVVTHMAGEPDAWLKTDVPVPGPELEQVLRNSHLHLAAGSALVSYASSCEFRGHHVPHLVIQTASGPVTVMVLVHEGVSKTVRFDEQGYRGVIVPAAGHGSLAVLAHDADADIQTVERIAARVLDSIVWTG